MFTKPRLKKNSPVWKYENYTQKYWYVFPWAVRDNTYTSVVTRKSVGIVQVVLYKWYCQCLEMWTVLRIQFCVFINHSLMSRNLQAECAFWLRAYTTLSYHITYCIRLIPNITRVPSSVKYAAQSQFCENVK